MAGSVNFNSYVYYYFVPPRSGNVVFTTTVTGGSPYGVWTFVGSGYYPVDGSGARALQRRTHSSTATATGRWAPLRTILRSSTPTT